MKKKFEYFEIVKIVNYSNPKLKEVINKKGYIAGDAWWKYRKVDLRCFCYW